MFKATCFVVLFLIGNYFDEGFAQNKSIEVSPKSPVDVRENTQEFVKCIVNDSNKNDEFNRTAEWFDEDDKPLPVNKSDQGDYQTFDKNDTSVTATLYIKGEIIEDKFEKKFTCKGQITPKETLNETYVAKIVVSPQVTTSSVASNYTCLNQEATLSCTVRGYPTPNVSWFPEQNTVIKNKKVEGQPDLIVTNLYVFNLEKTQNFTCIAEDVKSSNYSAKKNLIVTVRDEKLSGITHKLNGTNNCRISWNVSDVPAYVDAYQIRYVSKEEQRTIEIKGNRTSYEITLDANADNVSVALVMSECIGPFVESKGTCIFMEPTEGTTTTASPPSEPFKIPFIATTVILGSLSVILFIVFIVFCFVQRKKESKTKSKSVGEEGIRFSNKYVSKRKIRISLPKTQQPTYENQNNVNTGVQESDEFVQEVIYNPAAEIPELNVTTNEKNFLSTHRPSYDHHHGHTSQDENEYVQPMDKSNEYMPVDPVYNVVDENPVYANMRGYDTNQSPPPPIPKDYVS